MTCNLEGLLIVIVYKILEASENFRKTVSIRLIKSYYTKYTQHAIYTEYGLNYIQ